MVRTQQSAMEKEAVSHNLLGQRLGRKGRDTRDRIIAATEKLLLQPAGAPISLSAVAREASLGMTTLYLYFTDLPELLIAVLAPIMETAEDSYVRHLRERWPDEDLGEHCLRFVEAYHAFWVRHARILHLRNHYADNNDERMRVCRVAGSRTVIDLFIEQMDAVDTPRYSAARDMAAVLLTGIERMVTVATDPNFRSLMAEQDTSSHVRNLLHAEGRLLELAIRDGRETVRRVISRGA
jgi:AcrR family transcriptional regulator